MKLQLVIDKEVVVRDGKPVEIELEDEVQIAAFKNQGFEEVTEESKKK